MLRTKAGATIDSIESMGVPERVSRAAGQHLDTNPG
jgi:hypothetical protein